MQTKKQKKESVANLKMFYRLFVLLATTTLSSLADRESSESRRYGYITNTNAIKVNGRYENIPESTVERLIDNGYQKSGTYGIVISRPGSSPKDSYLGLTKSNPGGFERGTHRISYKFTNDDQPYNAKEYCEGVSSLAMKKIVDRYGNYVGDVGRGVRIYRPYDRPTVSKYINGDADPIRIKMTDPYPTVRVRNRGVSGQNDGFERLLPHPYNGNDARDHESSENQEIRPYSVRPLSIWRNYPDNENEDSRSEYGASLRTDNVNVNSNTNIIRHRRNVEENDAFSIGNGAMKNSPLADKNDNDEDDDGVKEKSDE